MDDPDAALMLAFARGQEQAFVTLYRSYRDRMVSYCARLLRDRAQAEEAAQDVFLKLYRARERYEPQSRFSTFLYRIATNHCWNLRARLDNKLVQRDGTTHERAVSAGRDPLAALENSQLHDALAAALDQLPDKQRSALVLVHYEGLSYKDTAGVLDTSEGAVKSLIHRARETLTRELATFVAAEGEVQDAV
jgi:RNA polymerase sigma-70 factor (ECF subfamily)